MDTSTETWSKTEKAIAKRAYDLAYQRECDAIAAEVRQRAQQLDSPQDIWKLHSFLSARRRETDEKYDYRYSVLLMVFARLIHEQWLTLDDLTGLRDNKMDFIRGILEFAKGR